MKKAANLLFAGLEPSYLWEYSARFFEIASQSSSVFLDLKEFTSDSDHVQKVGSGNPTLIEFCTLVSFLLDVVSLVSMYIIYNISFIDEIIKIMMFLRA